MATTTTTGSRDDYTHLSIKDARLAINQKVNLIGRVDEFSVPSRSRGTDCYCTVKIVDDSCQEYGLMVNMFAETMDKLPHVNVLGDIIDLSQVVMKGHHGGINATYNKKFSSFALFEGESSDSFIPYQASLKYCLTDHGKKIITALRKPTSNLQSDSDDDVELKEPLLREIVEDKCCDLVCKILHVSEVSVDEWMLFVWDGTDAPPLNCQTRLADDLWNPLPLQVEALLLPREVLCTFPPVGTILRVIVDKSSAAHHGLQLPEIGKWVKFLKVMCKVRLGLWYGAFVSDTKLQILSDDEGYSVFFRQRNHEERISCQWGRIPFSCFPWPRRVTETDYPDTPSATLMDVLTYPKVTAISKCIVRVVAICPGRVDKLRIPTGEYRMRLTLEDPTARIHAVLGDESAVKLFGGYPSNEILKQKLNKLVGIDEIDSNNENAVRQPPWIECCLKSYYLDKENPWETRRHMIFGTKIAE